MTRTVLVTTSYPGREGDPAGHFVRTEARERALGGAEVTVLAPRPRREPAELPPGEAGIDVVWLPGGDAFGAPGALERLRERPLRLAGAARFVRAARRALRDLGAVDELVLHWLVPCAWPIASGAAARRVEVVVHGSDVRVVERLPRAGRVAIVSGLVRRGARFRFVSRDLERRLAAATTARVLERSVVAPSPIDVSDAPARAGARARLGVGPGERLAVVVGRLVPSKRPDVAVRLALRARADRVVVVGDGPLAGAVRALSPAVELAGACPRDVALAWIAAADVLVTASRAEGAPTVVREARALGVPVLAVPCGDLSDWARRDAGITLVEA